MRLADDHVTIDWQKILRRYRTALSAVGNDLAARPELEAEVVNRAYRIVDETLVALGYAGLGPTEPFLDDDVGARRADQSVHPSASLQAAQVMFDSVLPSLMEQLPGMGTPRATIALASALNESILRRVTFASVQYVDVLRKDLAVAQRRERVAEDLRDLPTPRHDALTSVAERLTNRELEVLRLLSQALSNSQIASALSIAEGTVKRHVSNLFRKLGGATSRLDAVMRASALGLMRESVRDSR